MNTGERLEKMAENNMGNTLKGFDGNTLSEDQAKRVHEVLTEEVDYSNVSEEDYREIENESDSAIVNASIDPLTGEVITIEPEENEDDFIDNLSNFIDMNTELVKIPEDIKFILSEHYTEKEIDNLEKILLDTKQSEIRNLSEEKAKKLTRDEIVYFFTDKEEGDTIDHDDRIKFLIKISSIMKVSLDAIDIDKSIDKIYDKAYKEFGGDNGKITEHIIQLTDDAIEKAKYEDDAFAKVRKLEYRKQVLLEGIGFKGFKEAITVKKANLMRGWLSGINSNKQLKTPFGKEMAKFHKRASTSLIKIPDLDLIGQHIAYVLTKLDIFDTDLYIKEKVSHRRLMYTLFKYVNGNKMKEDYCMIFASWLLTNIYKSTLTISDLSEEVYGDRTCKDIIYIDTIKDKNTVKFLKELKEVMDLLN